MNRLEFIKSTKSILFFIPLVRILKFDEDSNMSSNRSNKISNNFFPDKDNYLVAATCLFATPAWGDGKNGDDSYVDAFVDVECYDNLYSAQGRFGDNTEIEVNIIREMSIGFSPADAKKIFYDGIKNINILILGHKRNSDPDRIPSINDKWNVRWEFLMKFKKGNILATGYNDPAIEYKFALEQTPINMPTSEKGKKKFWNRNELIDHQTLKAPVG